MYLVSSKHCLRLEYNCNEKKYRRSTLNCWNHKAPASLFCPQDEPYKPLPVVERHLAPRPSDRKANTSSRQTKKLSLSSGTPSLGLRCSGGTAGVAPDGQASLRDSFVRRANTDSTHTKKPHLSMRLSCSGGADGNRWSGIPARRLAATGRSEAGTNGKKPCHF